MLGIVPFCADVEGDGRAPHTKFMCAEAPCLPPLPRSVCGVVAGERADIGDMLPGTQSLHHIRTQVGSCGVPEMTVPRAIRVWMWMWVVACTAFCELPTWVISIASLHF